MRQRCNAWHNNASDDTRPLVFRIAHFPCMRDHHESNPNSPPQNYHETHPNLIKMFRIATPSECIRSRSQLLGIRS